VAKFVKDKIIKILNLINKWKVLLIIVLIGAGLFYWYEWRPSQIRKICQEKVENHDRELLESAIKSKLVKEGGDIYDFCLRQHGLEK